MRYKGIRYMRQFIVSSFVSKNGGGNKAAVVFDDIGLSEKKMQKIAARNDFSETAFIDIKNSYKNKFRVRYFTPCEEVDICGHAALASFKVLRELEYLSKNSAWHINKAGELKVMIENDAILIEMRKPELVMQLTKESIMEVVDINETDIIPGSSGKIDVISTGLKDIILEVKGIEVLKSISIRKSKMIELCKENKLIGMHIVSRETIEKDSDFCCRNFAPAVGIDEESATGTSNASLLYYVIVNNNNFEYNKVYKIEQGYFMNSPSNIYVKADKKDGSIYVGGIARIEDMEEI